jgi:hypothetical protein
VQVSEFILRSLRKIDRLVCPNGYKYIDESRIEFFGQAANDYVREAIEKAETGLMISKFGTIELNAVCCCKRVTEGLKFSDYLDYVKRKGCIYPYEALKALHINAGFFPMSEELQYRYSDLVLKDLKEIDILGSYVDQESYLEKELNHCSKIDIYGYCAPFAWKNPWTMTLENKRVLIVHPFTESIRRQYEKRDKLFKDPDVLPKFKELILVKAVQSIAGNGKTTGFKDWFEALASMEYEIDTHDYDIALIGCGAYGMDLAAHCKRKGKIAIHMASWVQMLFGIYGDRWINQQPEYADLINEYWARPLDEEKPKWAEKVENAAYW